MKEKELLSNYIEIGHFWTMLMSLESLLED